MEPAFVPSLPWIIPFAALLSGLAILPFAAPHFWESNLHKLGVAVAPGIPVLVLYVIHAPHALVEAAVHYVSFIVLLGSLFVISGGVLMDGDLEATPWVNTLFLAFGAAIASFVGTTGASMLLIRPLLHTNSERQHVVHTVVFFIFLVSNIGGALTPLGDPPLFLGYLAGVPFTWTFRLVPHWLFGCVFLLAIYFVWDTWALRRETRSDIARDKTRLKPLRLTGVHNLLPLGGILAAAALLDEPWRELAMVALAVVSYYTTSHHVRHANRFTFHPILEVAAVFAGIFLTMIPALDILRTHGAALGVREPWHFFWATGVLSAFLDNAPTYLAFLAVGQALDLPREVVGLPHSILTAISVGAVFMGATSYIGNGPNFMVRSIAEARGVKMPGFGGYMLYSMAVLLPVFVALTVVFFT
jgi:Na+/H+ antiporter NhaD/arsenite permease-like protein